jgi:hypothetical protein
VTRAAIRPASTPPISSSKPAWPSTCRRADDAVRPRPFGCCARPSEDQRRSRAWTRRPPSTRTSGSSAASAGGGVGHTDPKLTLAVYQQVLDLGKVRSRPSSRRSGARSPRRARSSTARAHSPGFRNESGTGDEKPPPRATRGHWRLEKPAVLQGIPRERMKGLEHSTFCMPNGSSWILREARKVPICSDLSSG